MKSHILGFTLIELVISLSIVIFIMLIGVKGMKPLMLKNDMTNQVNNFVRMQHLARQTAIFRQSIVTLCASNDAKTCLPKKYWNEGMLIFTDNNGNRIIDKDDHRIHFYKTEIKNIQITWRSFQNKSYLQFNAAGWTNNQNGTFRFCFDNEAATFSKALIINRAGRLIPSSDTNDDGFDEDSNGNKITC